MRGEDHVPGGRQGAEGLTNITLSVIYVKLTFRTDQSVNAGIQEQGLRPLCPQGRA